MSYHDGMNINAGCLKRVLPSAEDEKLLIDAFHVSRETIALLQIYADLLVEWQSKTNLVSNATVQNLWHRHICDSLQYKDILPSSTRWLDLGTGAGFPGLVVAIARRDEPEFDMQLVESNSKKCAFLRKVIRQTGAPTSVTSSRIESATKLFDDRQVITARALASLGGLFNYTSSWLGNGATGIFSKGRDYLQELEDCRGVWDFDLIIHNSRIAEDSVLLEIQNLRSIES